MVAALPRAEHDLHGRHIARLLSGNLCGIDASDIYMQLVRALKEVNSLLLMVVYRSCLPLAISWKIIWPNQYIVLINDSIFNNDFTYE